MIGKFRDERTKTEMKRIHSSIEEANKKMLKMRIMQLQSGDTERRHMSVQKMYLTLQIMEKQSPARQKI